MCKNLQDCGDYCNIMVKRAEELQGIYERKDAEEAGRLVWNLRSRVEVLRHWTGKLCKRWSVLPRWTKINRTVP